MYGHVEWILSYGYIGISYRLRHRDTATTPTEALPPAAAKTATTPTTDITHRHPPIHPSSEMRDWLSICHRHSHSYRPSRGRRSGQRATVFLPRATRGQPGHRQGVATTRVRVIVRVCVLPLLDSHWSAAGTNCLSSFIDCFIHSHSLKNRNDMCSLLPYLSSYYLR